MSRSHVSGGPSRLAPGVAAVAGALAFLAPARAQADVVHLSDERTIEGRIVREDAQSIEVELEGGRIVVSRADVASIERRPWAPRAAGGGPVVATGTGDVGSLPRPATASAEVDEETKRLETQVKGVVGDARADLSGSVRETPSEVAAREAQWADAIRRMGPKAAPGLAAALGRETDPVVADAILAGLLAFPEAIPAEVLSQALTRRGVSATPALVRAVGLAGDAAARDEGVSALGDLLRRVDSDWTEAERTPSAPGTQERIMHDATLRGAAIQALGATATPAALDVLFGLALVPARTEYELDLRDAAISAISEAVGRREARAGASEPALAKIVSFIERARGSVLGALLNEFSDRRSAAVRQVAISILRRPSAEADDRETAAERKGAAVALRPWIRAPRKPGDPEPDAAAQRIIVGLESDAVEELRLEAAFGMGEIGSRANLGRLVRIFASDPSPTVRDVAHRSLVKLAKGFDAGDAAAWRVWVEKNP